MNEQLTKDQRDRCLSDFDLRALIQAYEAGGITHGFAPHVLICLYELSDRRAADDARLGLKEPRS